MSRKKKTRSAAKKTSAPAAPKAVVQEALEVTWLLKGKLKSERMAYLRIGALLVQVRDKKLFVALKHPTIEHYAERRLKLRRSSLYNYLQVFDWVTECHPEWLKPKPKGYIPEFTDTNDLMWIEQTLNDKTRRLSDKTMEELKALRAKALEGNLKDDELEQWRKRGARTTTGLKSFLSKIRLLRRRGAEVKDMPTEAMKLMDQLIEVVDNAVDSLPK